MSKRMFDASDSGKVWPSARPPRRNPSAGRGSSPGGPARRPCRSASGSRCRAARACPAEFGFRPRWASAARRPPGTRAGRGSPQSRCGCLRIRWPPSRWGWCRSRWSWGRAWPVRRARPPACRRTSGCGPNPGWGSRSRQVGVSPLRTMPPSARARQGAAVFSWGIRSFFGFCFGLFRGRPATLRILRTGGPPALRVPPADGPFGRPGRKGIPARKNPPSVSASLSPFSASAAAVRSPRSP